MEVELESEEEFDELFGDRDSEIAEDDYGYGDFNPYGYETEFEQSTEGEGEEEEEEEEEGEGADEIIPATDEVEPESFQRKVIRTKRNNLLDFQNVHDLVNFLSKIELVWPEDLPFYNEEEFNADPKHINFPLSYYHCSQKEKAVLWHAENFRKQFMYKFEKRRPPLIAPRNECDCQKLFPTYIQPTALGYLEFYECETCIQFFKDYLAPQLMEPVPDLPIRVRSHSVVLKDRQANSFEHAIIVVSLLIGAGFDAYVVDGYASKEITTMCSTEDYVDNFEEKEDYFGDMFSGNNIGQLDDEKDNSAQDENDDQSQQQAEEDFFSRREDETVRPVSPSKYRLKFKKTFESKYEHEMQLREERKREEEERLQKEQEYKEWLSNQRPPTPDIMQGFRTHSWILVLPNQMQMVDLEVNEAEAEAEGEGEGEEEEDEDEEYEERLPQAPPPVPFFLEPFSGTKREITDPNFLGIEAVFNHKNYWINIQERGPTSTCADLNYDLEETTCWAKLLYEHSKKKKVVDESQHVSSFQDEEDEDIAVPEMIIDMPASWTSDLRISEEDYKNKYPGGKKVFEYNDAIVELAAPYVNADGLVRRVIKFSGRSRLPKNLIYIEERFENRKDKMNRRVWHKRGRVVHEYFGKGRRDALKEHIHVAGKNKPHYPRHLYYYSNAHPENVYHRQVVNKGLVEHFEHREDCLFYRFTAFGGVLCRTLPAPDERTKTKEFVEFLKGDAGRKRPRRKILGIIEKFHRNPNEDADDDISEKHMLIEEGKFRVLFHYGDENYTRRILEYFKSVKGFKKDTVDFKPEDCIEFRVGPFTPKSTTYQRYLILKELLKGQTKSMTKSRDAEDEVYHTVTNRVQEDWRNELEMDYSSQSREEERVRKEIDNQEENIDWSSIDFASPYLELFVPKNKDEEVMLKQFILQNAKDRIIRQAEHITKSYYEESAKLKELLTTPPSTKEETEAQHQGFSSFYDKVLCKMHIMEQRLIRLRAKAPGNYCSLLIQVLQHPLLNKYTLEEKWLKQQRLIESLKPPEEIKKPESLSCCRLDYTYKYIEKKKAPPPPPPVEPNPDETAGVEVQGETGTGTSTVQTNQQEIAIEAQKSAVAADAVKTQEQTVAPKVTEGKSTQGPPPPPTTPTAS